jgi:hypothetical protein
MPLIPENEMVGIVADKGAQVMRYSITYRYCRYCTSRREIHDIAVLTIEPE